MHFDCGICPPHGLDSYFLDNRLDRKPRLLRRLGSCTLVERTTSGGSGRVCSAAADDGIKRQAHREKYWAGESRPPMRSHVATVSRKSEGATADATDAAKKGQKTSARALPIRSSPVGTAPSLRSKLATLKTPAKPPPAPERQDGRSQDATLRPQPRPPGARAPAPDVRGPQPARSTTRSSPRPPSAARSSATSPTTAPPPWSPALRSPPSSAPTSSSSSTPPRPTTRAHRQMRESALGRGPPPRVRADRRRARRHPQDHRHAGEEVRSRRDPHRQPRQRRRGAAREREARLRDAAEARGGGEEVGLGADRERGHPVLRLRSGGEREGQVARWTRCRG